MRFFVRFRLKLRLVEAFAALAECGKIKYFHFPASSGKKCYFVVIYVFVGQIYL